MMQYTTASPAKSHKRYTPFSRRSRAELPNECKVIEELTVEHRPYAVELKDAKVFGAAYREGHQWFANDGAPIASSPDIYSITLPARRG